jgi:hypothetical protein
MKKIFHRFLPVIISLLICSVFLLPRLTLADDPSLPNPLGKNVNLIDVLLRVMQIALAAVDIFALFMFILGGFEFLVSAGNPNMIKKAKDTLLWATIGILVITLSYSILKFIFEEVQKGFGP